MEFCSLTLIASMATVQRMKLPQERKTADGLAGEKFFIDFVRNEN